MAVALLNYKKEPIIVKVLQVGEMTVKLQYLKGSYNRPSVPLYLPGRSGRPQELWTDNLPKSCVILSNFQLDDNNVLVAGTKAYLRKAYKEIKARLNNT